MKKYKCLNKQEFVNGEYKLVPIRFEDRHKIMRWRNEQIFHLRQEKKLTKDDQDKYFESVISSLFDLSQPDQILFSLLKEDTCVGYGGLVHLNWKDKNSEISFVMDTKLETKNFVLFWNLFLSFIKQLAFKELDLHKIYTYSFDLRPKLYSALSTSGLICEGRLIDHCKVNSKFCDVLYHSCINPIHNLQIREVSKEDIKLLFEWKNEYYTRKKAFNSQKIEWETHIKWFKNKLKDKNCYMFIISNMQNFPVGQVRYEKIDNDWLIDFAVNKYFRGLGLGELIIKKSMDIVGMGSFLAKVKNSNTPSIKVFRNLGFTEFSENKTVSNFTYHQ